MFLDWIHLEAKIVLNFYSTVARYIVKGITIWFSELINQIKNLVNWVTGIITG